MSLLGDIACCSICLSGFSEGKYQETPLGRVTITPCRHKFHKHCLDQALIVGPTCPHCRRTLTNNPPGGVAGHQFFGMVSDQDYLDGLSEEPWAGWQEEHRNHIYVGELLKTSMQHWRETVLSL